jgi:hypothetical protein
VANGPLRVTDQYSQGGAAADPNFYFQPTTSSGTPEFTPPPAGTINPQRVRDMFYGPGAWYANHPNWSGPNTTPTSAAFGKITTKSGNRDQQLALKYYF